MKVKNILVVIGLIILLSITIGVAVVSGLDSDVTISIVAGLISIAFGLIKINLDSDKMFKELFTEFNDKYDNNFNDLLNKIRKGEVRVINLSERLLIIDYLNLCSEEYLWKKRGRIPQKVWDAWEEGIVSNLCLEPIKRVFEDEMSDLTRKKSYYGFSEYIEKKLNE